MRSSRTIIFELVFNLVVVNIACYALMPFKILLISYFVDFRIKCSSIVEMNMSDWQILKCECRVSFHLHRYGNFISIHLREILETKKFLWEFLTC